MDGIIGPETMGALDRACGLEPNPAAAEASARYRARTSGGGGAGGAGGATGVDIPGVPGVPGGGGGDLSLSSIDRIIERTAKFESNGKYDAWNPDDAGHGVSFGLVQFNQKVGGLPSLLSRMAQANPQKFSEIMGPHAGNMRNAGWVRGADLNDPDIKARMRRAAQDPEFQQVQRDLAREQYFEPARRMAAEMGVTSERGLAMLFDSCIQNGVGGTRGFLTRAKQGGGDERAVLERFAGLADRGNANGRRHKILRETGFSDSPPAEGPSRPATPGAQPSISGPSAAGGTSAAAAAGPIGPGTKVLMIGDSHTCGVYGDEMDRLLRSTGATVESYGSSGSSPSWWLNGTRTQSGFVARHANGTSERPHWQTPHDTPKLAELIREHRPDVLVVSLGGNMRGMSPAQIREQVKKLADVAKENGTRLVWVGPPERGVDDSNPQDLARFNAELRAAVQPYGGFVDSSRYTDYAGGDGVHYSGARGNQVARGWAQGVFSEIQGQR